MPVWGHDQDAPHSAKDASGEPLERQGRVGERFLVAFYRWPFPPTEHELDWPMVTGLAARLRGLTVLVPGDAPRVYQEEFARVEYLPARRGTLLGRLRFVFAAARRMCRAGRFAPIVACGSDPLGSLACYGATRLAPGHLVVQVQDDFWGDFYLKGQSYQRRLASRLMGFLVRRADRVRVLSEGDLERVLGLGLEVGRVRVIRSRVDLHKFQGRQEDDGRREGVRFVFVGTLVERKGISVLLPAFADVVRHLGHAELLMVGEGPLRAWGEEWTARAGLRDRVRWLGRVQHAAVKNLLDRAHCIVLPSFSEGTPRALMEAMALGVPCVASNVGGVSSVLPPACPDARLVPAGDPAALSLAMIAVAERWERGQVDGPALRRWVEGRFGLDRHVEGMSALFGEFPAGASPTEG